MIARNEKNNCFDGVEEPMLGRLRLRGLADHLVLNGNFLPVVKIHSMSIRSVATGPLDISEDKPTGYSGAYHQKGMP